jgi:hypothetical protein
MNISLFCLTDQSLIKKSLLISILLSLLLVSCKKEKDNDSNVKEFPTYGIYFSCRINNELVEFESPSAFLYSSSKSLKRLHKLPGFEKDSAILENSYGYLDDNYYIVFGMGDSFLVDTTSLLGPNVQNILFRPGSYPFQFLSLEWGIDEATFKYCGFHITINDLKKGIYYTSYIDQREHGNTEEFNDFTTKSSFNLSKSFLVTDGILIESTFKCKLYKNESINDTSMLTDGILKCCIYTNELPNISKSN